MDLIADAITGAGRTAGLFGGIMEGAKDKIGEVKKEHPKSAKVVDAMINGPPKMLGAMKSMAGKGAGIAGVSLSVSSLLRQSQLFTGIIGAFFQVVGGFIDVLLAPFMPFFAKVIGALGAKIPIFQEYVQKIYNWIAENIFPIIAKWAGYIWEGLKVVWDVIKVIWDAAKPLIDSLWQSFKDNLLPIIKGIGSFIKDTIFPIIKEIIKIYMMIVDKVLWPILSKVLWPIFKIIAKLYVEYIKLIWKLIGFLWEYVGKYIFKAVGWLLGFFPPMLRAFGDFLEGFLEFKWLKKGLAEILEFFANIVNSLAGFSVFGKKPFASLAGLGDNLDGLVSTLRDPGTNATSKLEVVVKTDNGSQIEQQTQFDMMQGEQKAVDAASEWNIDETSFEKPVISLT